MLSSVDWYVEIVVSIAFRSILSINPPHATFCLKLSRSRSLSFLQASRFLNWNDSLRLKHFGFFFHLPFLRGKVTFLIKLNFSMTIFHDNFSNIDEKCHVPQPQLKCNSAAAQMNKSQSILNRIEMNGMREMIYFLL